MPVRFSNMFSNPLSEYHIDHVTQALSRLGVIIQTYMLDTMTPENITGIWQLVEKDNNKFMNLTIICNNENTYRTLSNVS